MKKSGQFGEEGRRGHPPGRRVARSIRVWRGETHGLMKDVRQAMGRMIEETRAILGEDDQGRSLRTTVARLGDLTRSQAFLWTELGLKAQERSSRIARSLLEPLHLPLDWMPRAQVEAAAAADIYAGYMLLRERSRRWPGLVRGRDWELQHWRGATRALDTITSLGGVLIKAGQYASVRPDLLPRPYIDKLSTLQDRVPPRRWSEMQGVVRRELGRRPEEVFATIEPEPVAAASLAQVHRASLPGGRLVAVKIQYPDLAELVATDLGALETIFNTIARVEPQVQLQPITAYLRSTVPLELDFVREAKMAMALRARLAHRDDVFIPEVIEELSSRRVLVTDFAHGIKITDREALVEAGIDVRAVARLLTDVYAEQILRLGLLHADPHPGNILVQPGPRLVLLDHGLTVTVSPHIVQALAGMVHAMASGDVEALMAQMTQAGLRVGGETDVLSMLQLAGVLLGAEGAGGIETLGQQVSAGIRDVPDELITVGRALGLLNSACRELDPELDSLEIVATYAQQDSPAGVM